MILLKSLNSQLDTLKLSFEEAILHGNSFEEVKKIYRQIKEIEKLIVEREALLKGNR